MAGTSEEAWGNHGEEKQAADVNSESHRHPDLSQRRETEPSACCWREQFFTLITYFSAASCHSTGVRGFHRLRQPWLDYHARSQIEPLARLEPRSGVELIAAWIRVRRCTLPEALRRSSPDQGKFALSSFSVTLRPGTQHSLFLSPECQSVMRVTTTSQRGFTEVGNIRRGCSVIALSCTIAAARLEALRRLEGRKLALVVE